MSRLQKSNGIQDVNVSRLAMEVSKEKPFNVVILHDVKCVKIADDSGNEQIQLKFEFRTPEADPTKARYFTHTERAVIEPTKNATVEQLCEYQDNRIAHIFNVFAGKPDAHKAIAIGDKVVALGAFSSEGLKTEEEANEAFFKAIETHFHKGKNGAEVWKNSKLQPIAKWIKLTYYGEYLQVGTIPFLAEYEEGKAPLLKLSATELTKLTPQLKTNPAIANGGNNNPPPASDKMPDGFFNS